MIQAEANEIKKQFKPDKLSAHRLAYAYVGHGKEVIAKDEPVLATMPEEDMHKFYGLLQKALSGKIGKTLIPAAFRTETEQDGESMHQMLVKMWENGLGTGKLLDDFYQRVIDAYDYAENYLILLVHATYDVPAVTTDGIRNEDASEEAYEFITCAICPVKTEKAGLAFDPEKGTIGSKEQRFAVDAPVNGFLFPSFSGRAADIHELLFYAKKPDGMHKELYEMLVGSPAPMSASEQKGVFEKAIESALGDEPSFEAVRGINERVQEIIERGALSDEPPRISKDLVKELPEGAGAGAGEIMRVDEVYEEAGCGDEDLLAVNVIDAGRFAIKAPDVSITVANGQTHLLEAKVIDGKKCVIVQAESIEVNGRPVK